MVISYNDLCDKKMNKGDLLCNKTKISKKTMDKMTNVNGDRRE